MDTSVFFQYPTLGGGSSAPEPAPDPGFLPHATVEEWDAVLAATETLRFHPGDIVLRAGERDRALYLLLDGRLEAEGSGAEIAAPATVGAAGFLDGAAARGHAPRAHARRAGAAELGRLRGARRPRPAARPDDPLRPRPRPRRPAARRRRDAPGVDGMTAFPNYTQIPARLSVGTWQAIRVVTLLGADRPRHGPGRGARRRPGRDVEGRDPRAAAAVAGRARAVAQHLPALGLQPDAAGARAVEGADRAAVAQGVRLRDRRGACSSPSCRCASWGWTTPGRRARCSCSARCPARTWAGRC